jgi:citrate lyase subunit beta/citryl-CoA lyase/(S)-citramalyl-CoA lyase
VPLDAKETARAAALAFLSARPVTGPAVGVRCNALSTLFGLADAALLGTAPRAADFVMVPKVAAAAEMRLLAEAFGASPIPLWAVVESAAGLDEAAEISRAVGPKGGLLFGGADYSADIGADLSEWDAMLYARGALSNAAALGGVQLLDVPWLDVKDRAGLEASTRRVKAMGFTGRACIHPDQVAPVNAVFTPTPAEIERARRVIAALEEAKGAAALLDGKLVELPVIRAANRVLARAGET